MKRATTPAGGRGTAISRMFSAAMRPVSRFCSRTFTPASRFEPFADAGSALPAPDRRLSPTSPLVTVAASLHNEAVAMIDLYALTSPNVQKIYIMLEECRLPYREKFVDVWKGEQYHPDFGKINPNNKIPAIVDHDGPGGKAFTVFESGAILLYLAEKTGKFLPSDPARKYEVLQWLIADSPGWGRCSGNGPISSCSPPRAATMRWGATPPSSSGSTRCWSSGSPRCRCSGPGLLDRRHRDLPVDEKSRCPGVKWDDHPNLARWFDAISERPAVKAALAKVAVIKSNRETASDDDKDRFFNRGRYARA